MAALNPSAEIIGQYLERKLREGTKLEFVCSPNVDGTVTALIYERNVETGIGMMDEIVQSADGITIDNAIRHLARKLS